jgi:hypothetical protein
MPHGTYLYLCALFHLYQADKVYLGKVRYGKIASYSMVKVWWHYATFLKICFSFYVADPDPGSEAFFTLGLGSRVPHPPIFFIA